MQGVDNNWVPCPPGELQELALRLRGQRLWNNFRVTALTVVITAGVFLVSWAGAQSLQKALHGKDKPASHPRPERSLPEPAFQAPDGR